MQTDFSSLTPD